MNSFNHYAYGAIGDWMYRVVAGLDHDSAAPGYRHVMIHPQPGGGLTFAKATLMTPYGEASSGWSLDGDRLTVTATVPPNTRATIRLPGARLSDVREGDRALAASLGIARPAQVGDDVVAELGSGRYVFGYMAPELAARVRATPGR